LLLNFVLGHVNSHMDGKMKLILFKFYRNEIVTLNLRKKN
jgi:hypothetical protein